MDHFEQIWEKAEEATKQYYSESLNIIIGKIKSQLDTLLLTTDQNEKIDLLGKILLDITFISNKLNINVYFALKNELDNLKIKIFDPDDD